MFHSVSPHTLFFFMKHFRYPVTRLLPQNYTPGSPSNGKQLLLSTFQEEAAKRQELVRTSKAQNIWLPVDLEPEKAMAPYSSTLAWKILWMEEPGRLQSMGLLRVRHNWANSLWLFTSMHWRRKWQPTPVFLPGESQGRGSLVGCRLWGRTESDTTEVT